METLTLVQKNAAGAATAIKIKWFLVGALSAMAVFLVFFPRARPIFIPYYSYLRMVAFTSLGKNPLCTAADAARGREMAPDKEALVEKLRAEIRLVRSDENQNTLWQTPRGQFWLPAGASRDFLSSLVAEQEVGIYHHRDAGVRSGDIVLDCGANVGAFTREALLRGAKLVIAIEPAPENVLCLRRNLAAEIARGRVVVYEKGVWNRDEELIMEVRQKNPGANSICAGPGGCVGPRIRLTTIDKLVTELVLSRVDFIKMDIEGAERKALAGAAATLGKHRPRMAIATEHLDVLENARAVVQVAQGLQPSYRVSCGICETALGGTIAPDVMHFY